jgi:hypothetical protein
LRDLSGFETKLLNISGSCFEPRQWDVSDFNNYAMDLSGFELEILNKITLDALGFGNKKPYLVIKRNFFAQKVPFPHNFEKLWTYLVLKLDDLYTLFIGLYSCEL